VGCAARAGEWGKDKTLFAQKRAELKFFRFFLLFLDFCDFLYLQFCARLCKVNGLYQKTYANYRFLGRAKT